MPPKHRRGPPRTRKAAPVNENGRSSESGELVAKESLPVTTSSTHFDSINKTTSALKSSSSPNKAGKVVRFKEDEQTDAIAMHQKLPENGLVQMPSPLEQLSTVLLCEGNLLKQKVGSFRFFFTSAFKNRFIRLYEDRLEYGAWTSRGELVLRIKSPIWLNASMEVDVFKLNRYSSTVLSAAPRPKTKEEKKQAALEKKEAARKAKVDKAKAARRKIKIKRKAKADKKIAARLKKEAIQYAKIEKKRAALEKKEAEKQAKADEKKKIQDEKTAAKEEKQQAALEKKEAKKEAKAENLRLIQEEKETVRSAKVEKKQAAREEKEAKIQAKADEKKKIQDEKNAAKEEKREAKIEAKAEKLRLIEEKKEAIHRAKLEKKRAAREKKEEQKQAKADKKRLAREEKVGKKKQAADEDVPPRRSNFKSKSAPKVDVTSRLKARVNAQSQNVVALDDDEDDDGSDESEDGGSNSNADSSTDSQSDRSDDDDDDFYDDDEQDLDADDDDDESSEDDDDSDDSDDEHGTRGGAPSGTLDDLTDSSGSEADEDDDLHDDSDDDSIDFSGSVNDVKLSKTKARPAEEHKEVTGKRHSKQCAQSRSKTNQDGSSGKIDQRKKRHFSNHTLKHCSRIRDDDDDYVVRLISLRVQQPPRRANGKPGPWRHAVFVDDRRAAATARPGPAFLAALRAIETIKRTGRGRLLVEACAQIAAAPDSQLLQGQSPQQVVARTQPPRPRQGSAPTKAPRWDAVKSPPNAWPLPPRGWRPFSMKAVNHGLSAADAAVDDAIWAAAAANRPEDKQFEALEYFRNMLKGSNATAASAAAADSAAAGKADGGGAAKTEVKEMRVGPGDGSEVNSSSSRSSTDGSSSSGSRSRGKKSLLNMSTGELVQRIQADHSVPLTFRLTALVALKEARRLNEREFRKAKRGLFVGLGLKVDPEESSEGEEEANQGQAKSEPSAGDPELWLEAEEAASSGGGGGGGGGDAYSGGGGGGGSTYSDTYGGGGGGHSGSGGGGGAYSGGGGGGGGDAYSGGGGGGGSTYSDTYGGGGGGGGGSYAGGSSGITYGGGGGSSSQQGPQTPLSPMTSSDIEEESPRASPTFSFGRNLSSPNGSFSISLTGANPTSSVRPLTPNERNEMRDLVGIRERGGQWTEAQRERHNELRVVKKAWAAFLASPEGTAARARAAEAKMLASTAAAAGEDQAQAAGVPARAVTFRSSTASLEAAAFVLSDIDENENSSNISMQQQLQQSDNSRGVKIVVSEKLAPDPPRTNVVVVDPASLDFLCFTGGPWAANGTSAQLYAWLGMSAADAYPPPVAAAVQKPCDAFLFEYSTKGTAESEGSAQGAREMDLDAAAEPSSTSSLQAVIHLAVPTDLSLPAVVAEDALARAEAVAQLARCYRNVLAAWVDSAASSSLQQQESQTTTSSTLRLQPIGLRSYSDGKGSSVSGSGSSVGSSSSSKDATAEKINDEAWAAVTHDALIAGVGALSSASRAKLGAVELVLPTHAAAQAFTAMGFQKAGRRGRSISPNKSVKVEAKEEEIDSAAVVQAALSGRGVAKPESSSSTGSGGRRQSVWDVETNDESGVSGTSSSNSNGNDSRSRNSSCGNDSRSRRPSLWVDTGTAVSPAKKADTDRRPSLWTETSEDAPSAASPPAATSEVAAPVSPGGAPAATAAAPADDSVTAPAPTSTVEEVDAKVRAAEEDLAAKEKQQHTARAAVQSSNQKATAKETAAVEAETKASTAEATATEATSAAAALRLQAGRSAVVAKASMVAHQKGRMKLELCTARQESAHQSEAAAVTAETIAAQASHEHAELVSSASQARAEAQEAASSAEACARFAETADVVVVAAAEALREARKEAEEARSQAAVREATETTTTTNAAAVRTTDAAGDATPAVKLSSDVSEGVADKDEASAEKDATAAAAAATGNSNDEAVDLDDDVGDGKEKRVEGSHLTTSSKEDPKLQKMPSHEEDEKEKKATPAVDVPNPSTAEEVSLGESTVLTSGAVDVASSQAESSCLTNGKNTLVETAHEGALVTQKELLAGGEETPRVVDLQDSDEIDSARSVISDATPNADMAGKRGANNSFTSSDDEHSANGELPSSSASSPAAAKKSDAPAETHNSNKRSSSSSDGDAAAPAGSSVTTSRRQSMIDDKDLSGESDLDKLSLEDGLLELQELKRLGELTPEEYEDISSDFRQRHADRDKPDAAKDSSGDSGSTAEVVGSISDSSSGSESTSIPTTATQKQTIKSDTVEAEVEKATTSDAPTTSVTAKASASTDATTAATTPEEDTSSTSSNGNSSTSEMPAEKRAADTKEHALATNASAAPAAPSTPAAEGTSTQTSAKEKKGSAAPQDEEGDDSMTLDELADAFHEGLLTADEYKVLAADYLRREKRRKEQEEAEAAESADAADRSGASSSGLASPSSSKRRPKSSLGGIPEEEAEQDQKDASKQEKVEEAPPPPLQPTQASTEPVNASRGGRGGRGGRGRGAAAPPTPSGRGRGASGRSSGRGAPSVRGRGGRG